MTNGVDPDQTAPVLVTPVTPKKMKRQWSGTGTIELHILTKKKKSERNTITKDSIKCKTAQAESQEDSFLANGHQAILNPKQSEQNVKDKQKVD